MLSSCSDATIFTSNVKTYVSSDDINYALKWAELIGPIITFPILSAVSFLLNLTVILVIKNKKNQEAKLFQSKIFKYILMNTAFNCVECLICELKLTSMCLGEGSIYCSTIRTFKATKYVTISLGYMSETMKTCSIFTGILFSLQRYEETSKSKNQWLQKLSETRMSTIAILVILSSSVVSATKFSEYIFNNSYFDSPSPFRLTLSSYFNSDYQSILFLLHYILNDLVLLIVNLVVDIKLVICIKASLAQKSEILERFESSEPEKAKMKEEEKKRKKSENKANMMILTNLVIYLFCRLPELLEIIFEFFKPFSYIDHCEVDIFCYLLKNTIEYLYMLSYLFNILIYYKFNSNFRMGLANFFNLSQKK